MSDREFRVGDKVRPGKRGVIPRPAIDRVMEKVTKHPGGCWEFGGSKIKGYGRIGVGSRVDGSMKSKLAHRVTYEHFVGPVPDGLVLDHLCRNRACVNPEHLEPVTGGENIRRGYESRGVCRNGHSLAEAGTTRDSYGWNRCLICFKATEKRRIEGYTKRRRERRALAREGNQ